MYVNVNDDININVLVNASREYEELHSTLSWEMRGILPYLGTNILPYLGI